MSILYNRSNVTTIQPKIQAQTAKPAANPIPSTATQVAVNTANPPAASSPAKAIASVPNHEQSSIVPNLIGASQQVTTSSEQPVFLSTPVTSSSLVTASAVPDVLSDSLAESKSSIPTSRVADGNNDASSLRTGTPTALLVSTGLCGVIAFLLAIIVVKLFMDRRQRKKAVRSSSPREKALQFPETTLSHSRNRDVGGVGASPLPLIQRTCSASSIGSMMSLKKQEREPFPSQETVSIRKASVYGYVNLDGQYSTVEYLQPVGTSFTESRAWDGSRPSMTYDR